MYYLCSFFHYKFDLVTVLELSYHTIFFQFFHHLQSQLLKVLGSALKNENSNNEQFDNNWAITNSGRRQYDQKPLVNGLNCKAVLSTTLQPFYKKYVLIYQVKPHLI